MFEVSTKLAGHFWRATTVPMDQQDWDRLPDLLGVQPHERAEWHELLAALRQAVEEDLTDRQRRVFVAIALNNVPMDVLALELGSNRNAIYKTLFDADVSCGPAWPPTDISPDRFEATMNHGSSLDKLLATDPADVGCDRTFELLDVYVEVELAGQDPQPRFLEWQRTCAAAGHAEGTTKDCWRRLAGSTSEPGITGSGGAGRGGGWPPRPAEAAVPTRSRPGAPWCRRSGSTP